MTGARTRTPFPDGKRVLRRQKRSKSPRPWRKAADDAQSRFWARLPKRPTGVFRTCLPSAPAKESESNRFRIFYFGGARTRTPFPDGKRVLRRQKRSKSPRPWRKAADDAQSRFWARLPKRPTGATNYGARNQSAGQSVFRKSGMPGTATLTIAKYRNPIYISFFR